jgi:ketosteroid isomerase-like protein
MRKATVLTVFLWSLGCTESSGRTAQKGGPSSDRLSEEIIALERSALDRWIDGDPKGYLDLYAPEVTYFEPDQQTRVDGLESLKPVVARVKGRKGVIHRYEILAPKVQRHGEVALLSFQLLNYRKLPDGHDTVLERWNSTEVYRRMDGRWKIIHSHWSFTQPELNNREKEDR